MKRYSFFILLLFLSISLFLLAYLLTTIIFIPAIHSVQLACYPEKAEENGITSSAQTTSFVNKTTNETEIIIEYFQEPTLRITKHEFCHVAQTKRAIWFSPSCSYPIQKFYREVECYIAEELPNKLHNFIYQDLPQ